MSRASALLVTAALILVPPSLYAQSTPRLSGGTIGVLGPVSALASSSFGARTASTGSNARGTATTRSMTSAATVQPAAAGGACTIYGFLGGLSNGSTLNAIGVFDLTGQANGGYSLGATSATASASGGMLTAAVDATPTGSINGLVPRNAGTLFQFATDPGCSSGSAFSTSLASNPTGSGNTVVATAGTLSIQATYTTQYVYDPGNPYYCYYNNRPWQTFRCNIWSASVSFSFLTSSFPAQGAGTYSLNIVQATVTSP